jgi:hypothetical protein
MYNRSILFLLMCCCLSFGTTAHVMASASKVDAPGKSNIIHLRYGKAGVITYDLTNLQRQRLHKQCLRTGYGQRR